MEDAVTLTTSQDSSPAAFGPTLADELLVGGIDMHVHGYPEIGLEFHGRLDDISLARAAAARGMRAIVLKSHLWPTMDRAYHVNLQLGSDSDFEVFGSITLNPIAGGLLPLSVEAAAAHDARVVHLPTWGSLNDHQHTGPARQVLSGVVPSVPAWLDENAAVLIGDDGALRREVHDILAIAKDAGMVMFTGHVSARESRAVAEAAAGIGFDKLVFCHPLAALIDADLQALQEMVSLGAVIEFTHTAMLTPRPRMTIGDIQEVIEAVGADHCIITTDAFFGWTPPQSEQFRMFIGQLIHAGMSTDDIRKVSAGTPARLLGMADEPA